MDVRSGFCFSTAALTLFAFASRSVIDCSRKGVILSQSDINYRVIDLLGCFPDIKYHFSAIVITSYSIHYTKLYDSGN